MERIPLGEDAFLATLEQDPGRILRRQKPGPEGRPRSLVWCSRNPGAMSEVVLSNSLLVRLGGKLLSLKLTRFWNSSTRACIVPGLIRLRITHVCRTGLATLGVSAVVSSSEVQPVYASDDKSEQQTRDPTSDDR